MAILKITKADGSVVNLPDPSKLDFGIQDVDASTSGRNQSGDMFRDRVAVKRKVSCSWQNIKQDKAQQILNAITDQFFTLTCFDPLKGSTQSFTVYVGDRTLGAYTCHTGTWLWSSLSANFIER